MTEKLAPYKIRNRPFDAEYTIKTLHLARDKGDENGHTADRLPEDRRGALMAALSAVASYEQERHLLGSVFWGKPSTKQWTEAEAEAVIQWVAMAEEADGKWVPSVNALSEARAVINAYQADTEQQGLFPGGEPGRNQRDMPTW